MSAKKALIQRSRTIRRQIRSQLFGVSDTNQVLDYILIVRNSQEQKVEQKQTGIDKGSEDVGLEYLPGLFDYEYPRLNALCVC